ncbi:MAG TPA: TIGR03087 family PEP-CTERM/XrtA system glycosyltransferase [Stellaceae bacterium]|nr:TIGR03087 family PEP-CTERM/XrtA system glycosyltransferase [Stellaceae bacterium]
MRIFYICVRVPYPPERGDKIATFNHIRHLAQNHELHVFCLAESREERNDAAGLREYARSVSVVPLRPTLGKLRSVKALLGGESLSVAMLDEKALHDALEAACAALKPDVILVYSSNMAQFAERFPALPRIMLFSELDSLKWGQYVQRAPIPMRWLYRLESARLLEYERRIARSFTHSTVCTEWEKRDFERLIPGVPVDIVGNGVDLTYFRSERRPKNSTSLIFTGVMDYLPNVDGILWFCDEILPRVRNAIPEASLVICGSRPTAAIRNLTKRPGITVTGHVPDVRDHMDKAELAVAPLRITRGIQNKLLEALAMSLPCVASTAVWRGTTIPEGEGVLVADDPGAFAKHIVHLLRDHAYREEMAHRARAVVEEKYSWAVQMARLEAILDAVTARAPTVGHRRA